VQNHSLGWWMCKTPNGVVHGKLVATDEFMVLEVNEKIGELTNHLHVHIIGVGNEKFGWITLFTENAISWEKVN